MTRAQLQSTLSRAREEYDRLHPQVVVATDRLHTLLLVDALKDEPDLVRRLRILEKVGINKLSSYRDILLDKNLPVQPLHQAGQWVALTLQARAALVLLSTLEKPDAQEISSLQDT
jgi:hypothetical protein